MDTTALFGFTSSLENQPDPNSVTNEPKLHSRGSDKTASSTTTLTPSLHLVALPLINGQASLLAVSWTETGCAAQLLFNMTSKICSPPIAIWTSTQAQNIVCAEVVFRPPAENPCFNVSVLIATTNNQVYSIPLVVNVNQKSLHLIHSAYQVFPEHKFCQDYFQIHGCDFRENNKHLVIQDIRTVLSKDNTVFVWIVFSTGTAIRLSLLACLLQPSQGDIDEASETTTVQIHLLFPSPSASTTTVATTSTYKLLPLPNYHASSSLILPRTPIYEALSFGDGVSSLTFYTSDETFTGGIALSVGLSGELIAASNTDPSSWNRQTYEGTTITSNIIVGTKAIVKGVLGSMWRSWGSSSATTAPNSYHSTNTAESDNRLDTDTAAFFSTTGRATSSVASLPKGSLVDNSNTSTLSSVVVVDEGTTRTNDHKQQAISDNRTCSSMLVLHKYLLPQQTLLDPPRKITSVSIDPLGNMATISDTLGRVMLIDLSTKQIVRMWKGLRDAKCYWIVQQCTFLVIHARQRSIIEIWKMMHGPRIYKMELSSPRDGSSSQGFHRVIQCSTMSSSNTPKGTTTCYLMEDGSIISLLNAPFVQNEQASDSKIDSDGVYQQSEGTPLQIRSVTAISNESVDNTNRYFTPDTTVVRRGPALHLQLLNQLLSEESSVPPTPESIYNAILQFTSTSDLCHALDLVASSSHLEDGLLLEQQRSTEFYSRIAHLCQEKLAVAKDTEQEHLHLLQQKQTSMSGTDLLRRNIQFHTQVIEAYELIRKFELEIFGEEEVDYDSDENIGSTDSDVLIGVPRTPWAEEAMSWIKTYEEITGRRLHSTVDCAFSSSITGEGGNFHSRRSKLLRFSVFFKACRLQSISDIYHKPTLIGSEKNHLIPIELCDSSKDRAVILSHLFRPLLKDIFVFKVVNSIFSNLGLHRNFPLLEQYFGEWFMSLSANEASKASLYDMWCPILRWLQDMIAAAYDADIGALNDNNVLPHLQALCSKASDLPRAFLLAVVCREALFIASKQWEAKTYGKVSSKAAVRPWDRLLRKLRLCLVVSLRLEGDQRDPLPITIVNIEAGNVFSVFQWVARDQLTLSHKQDELDNVEIACRSSRLKLHPSLAESDASSKWKVLQRACRVRNKSTGERASLFFFAEKVDQPGPLLLYLSQFNCKIELAAHRALLLGEKWGKTPTSLHLIKDAICALRVLEGDQPQDSSIACAVRLEIWQTRIRPIYRALFFGFEEVPELSEDVMRPLVRDPGWLRGLAKVAAELLSLIERTPKILEQHYALEFEMHYDDDGLNSVESMPWPVVQDDIILRRLVQRSKPVNMDSLDIHKGIISAAHLTDDISSLVLCAPSFGDVFLSSSLFNERFQLCCRSEEQILFLRKAVYKKAREFNGPLLDRFDLDEIENLGKAWGFTESRIRSEFILAIYLHGKDAMVADLLTDLFRSDEVEYFVSEGLCIASIRIHATLKIIIQVKQFRPILSMLDAETCRWVKDQTDTGLVRHKAYGWDADSFPSLSATNELILKLLRMSSGTGVKTLMEKTQALSVLSATLLKAIQDGQDAASI